MRAAIIGIAMLVAFSVSANAQFRSCGAAYRDCVRKLGTVNENQCAAALARARRTGIFVGPLTGRRYTCG
jgi:hypothetical protein